MDVISIIMAAGKSSVDVALYTLLPIMVIMLIIMKYPLRSAVSSM